jgi:hypothetical protein
VNSAFIGTDLKEQLDNLKDHKTCYSWFNHRPLHINNYKNGRQFGFDTFLVSDATATFNKKGLEGQNFPRNLSTPLHTG